MNAKIHRTNSGRYYLTVTAETVIEQLELTAMREQMRESKDIVHEFGGSAAFNEEVGRSLELEMNLLVREPVEPSVRRKAGLMARIAGRI